MPQNLSEAARRYSILLASADSSTGNRLLAIDAEMRSLLPLLTGDNYAAIRRREQIHAADGTASTASRRAERKARESREAEDLSDLVFGPAAPSG